MALFTRRNTEKNSQLQSTLLSTSLPCEDQIREAAYQEIWPPFNGLNIGPVKVRPLRHAEIEACGQFSLIETFADKVQSKTVSADDMLEFSKIQHRVLKACLVSPTYDEVLKAASAYDHVEKCREQIEAFRREVAAENDKDKKRSMKRELIELELLYYQILPADFTGYVFSYGVELVSKNDIKKMDEDILLNLAVMAKNNNNRPSDNIDGNFTDFNRADIDRRAWIFFVAHQEEMKRNAGRRRNR